MKTKIDIVILVDVISALSDGTLLDGNLAMMDNGHLPSTDQGTPELCTVCQPGQTIQWTIHAVDLQTPVEIRRITFLDTRSDVEDSGDAAVESPPGDRLSLNVWSGVVPPWAIPGAVYKYRLELQMYEGKNSVMTIDSCSLRCA